MLSVRQRNDCVRQHHISKHAMSCCSDYCHRRPEIVQVSDYRNDHCQDKHAIDGDVNKSTTTTTTTKTKTPTTRHNYDVICEELINFFSFCPPPLLFPPSLQKQNNSKSITSFTPLLQTAVHIYCEAVSILTNQLKSTSTRCLQISPEMNVHSS